MKSKKNLSINAFLLTKLGLVYHPQITQGGGTTNQWNTVLPIQ